MKDIIITVLKMIKEAGFKAFIVGGAVRDMQMHIEPHDIDICTDALPSQTKDIFKNFIISPKGEKFGTIVLILDGEDVEITTFRLDGTSSDQRRPDEVFFTKDINEDLARRDLTINAMAFDPLSEELIDPFNGLDDIKNKVIRAVGDPEKRISEDALRILRAIRFGCKSGFSIDPDLQRVIHERRNDLVNVSKERQGQELQKILMCNDVHILGDFADVLSVIIPELKQCVGCEQNNEHHCFDVFKHMINTVQNCKKDTVLRLACLFHDIGKPKCKTTENGVDHFFCHAKVSADMTEEILRTLKFTNDMIKRVCTLIKFHDEDLSSSDKRLKKVMAELESAGLSIDDLLEIKIADSKAQNIKLLEDKLGILADIKKRSISVKNQAKTTKDLNISGNDIMVILGIKRGVRVGKILHMLLEKVLEDDTLNTKDKLIEIVKEMEEK